MQYNKGPSVIHTVPRNNSTEFPVADSIIVTFDKDIAKTSISGNIRVIDRKGSNIECRYQYTNRVITITPRADLEFNSTYTVILSGDNDPNNPQSNKGLLSPIGESMLGDYTFSFSTHMPELKAESIVGLTPNDILLKEPPKLKGETTNDTMNPTRTVEIQISSSNTFEAGLILWNGTIGLSEFENGVKPDIEMFDGRYYWRARSWSDVVSEIHGDWSEVAQFAIEQYADATVVATDSAEIDVAFPNSWNMLEPSIIDVYPADKRSSVKSNLKTISITIDQIITEKMLSDCYVTLTGEPVDDDIYSTAHGDVDMDFSVVYDHENETTTIICTLPELGGES